jgi:uncharacterized protein (TIGR02217 family)
MSFHEVVYPLSIDRCLSRREWMTNILELGDQSEQRIPIGTDGRLKFDASHGIRSLKDLQALIKFHSLRHGETYGFKVRDLLDYTVTRGTEGTLQHTYNGVTAAFQLQKIYTDAAATWIREIYKPEQGSVKVYKNGTLKTAVTHYNINYATGVITWTAGNIPILGDVIEWEGRFYVPVRFSVSKIPAAEIFATMEEATDGSGWVVRAGTVDMPDVGMVEIKDYT